MKKHMQFFNFGFLFLMRLMARSYFFNYTLPIVNFLLPVIIAFICYEILPMELLWPGLIVHPILTVGMLSLPLSLGTWNESMIIKRLKLSNISTRQVLFGFFFFYFLIALAGLVNVFIFLYAYSEIKGAIAPKEGLFFSSQFQGIKYWEFTGGVFLLICISLAIGLLISYSTFRFQTALFLGLSFYLTQSFLTGIFLSLDLIIRVKGILYTSYASPIFPAVRIIQAAWFANQDWSTLNLAFNNNWILTIDEFQQAISFSNQYWIHSLLGLGNLIIISGITITLFLTYKPR